MSMNPGALSVELQIFAFMLHYISEWLLIMNVDIEK